MHFIHDLFLQSNDGVVDNSKSIVAIFDKPVYSIM